MVPSIIINIMISTSSWVDQKKPHNDTLILQNSAQQMTSGER